MCTIVPIIASKWSTNNLVRKGSELQVVLCKPDIILTNSGLITSQWSRSAVHSGIIESMQVNEYDGRFDYSNGNSHVFFVLSKKNVFSIEARVAGSSYFGSTTFLFRPIMVSTISKKKFWSPWHLLIFFWNIWDSLLLMAFFDSHTTFFI